MKSVIMSLMCLPIFLIGCGTDVEDSSLLSDTPTESQTHIEDTDISTVEARTPAEIEVIRDAKKSGQIKELWKKYNNLKKVAPGSARAALVEISSLRFGTHPLRKEWVELYHYMLIENKATLVQHKRFSEIEIQMLTDINPRKNAKLIKQHEASLQEIEKGIRFFNLVGKDPAEEEIPIHWVDAAAVEDDDDR